METPFDDRDTGDAEVVSGDELPDSWWSASTRWSASSEVFVGAHAGAVGGRAGAGWLNGRPWLLVLPVLVLLAAGGVATGVTLSREASAPHPAPSTPRPATAALSGPTTTSPSGTTTSSTTSTPASPETTFSDGTWTVGPGVVPGTYETATAKNCYWERDAKADGLPSSVIANSFLSGHDVVTITASDALFKTQSCGTWSPLPATGPKVATFGDGLWAVGVDVAPGTYSAPGGSSCAWERDSAFSGAASAALASGTGGAGSGAAAPRSAPSGPAGSGATTTTAAKAPVVVTIAASDKGFRTQGCGTWTRAVVATATTPSTTTTAPRTTTTAPQSATTTTSSTVGSTSTTAGGGPAPRR